MEEGADRKKSGKEIIEKLEGVGRDYMSLIEEGMRVLQEEREALEKDTEEWERIKKKLEATQFPTRVKLNIGGTIFMTSLSTLQKEPNSFFGAMFSGNWKAELDEDGAYFIDRDGTHFRHILNYLRTGELVLPKKENHLVELQKEVEFYQLEGLLQAMKEGPDQEKKKPKWSTTIKSTDLRLDPSCTIAEYGASKTAQWLSVCADVWYSKGIHTFTLFIDNNTSNWIFVGVAARTWKEYTECNTGYLGHDAHSWAYGCCGGFGRMHKGTPSTYGQTFSSNATIVGTVDMDNRTLSFSLNGAHLGICHTGLPDEVCPAITLYQPGDKITLLG